MSLKRLRCASMVLGSWLAQPLGDSPCEHLAGYKLDIVALKSSIWLPLHGLNIFSAWHLKRHNFSRTISFFHSATDECYGARVGPAFN